MRRKRIRRPRPTAHSSLAAAALTAVLGGGGFVPGAMAAGLPDGASPPRQAVSCTSGRAVAVFTPGCAARGTEHPGAAGSTPHRGQFAAAPGSGTDSGRQLPAQGAALAGTALVLYGIARHIRKER